MFNSKLDKLQNTVEKLGLKLGLCIDCKTMEITSANDCWENNCTEGNMEHLSDKIIEINEKVNLLLDYLDVKVLNEAEEVYPKIVKNPNVVIRKENKDVNI